MKVTDEKKKLEKKGEKHSYAFFLLLRSRFEVL